MKTLVGIRRECVTLHPLGKFRNTVRKAYSAMGKDIGYIDYEEFNRGMEVGSDAQSKKLVRWDELAAELEWFDDAEIVTDANENPKVLTWLNA